jgi:hypothetical protein
VPTLVCTNMVHKPQVDEVLTEVSLSEASPTLLYDIACGFMLSMSETFRNVLCSSDSFSRVSLRIRLAVDE